MIINKMDDTLMKIYEIKDIEEIQYTDLAPINTKESKLMIIPCIYVRYDGGKTLMLCINDKYFDVFVKRVVDVYREEKGKVIVDKEFNPFGQKTLKIDEKSKKILDSGVLSNIGDVYKLYDGKKSYENNFLVQKEEFSLLLPLITYHIKKLLDHTDTRVTFDSDEVLNGYRNNYTINSRVNGIDELLYLSVKKKSEFEYTIDIRSASKKFSPIRLELGAYDDFISIFLYISDYGIISSDTYKVEDNKIKHEEIVFKDSSRVIHKDEYLSECANDKKDITELDNSDEMKWFSLPWNALYGINNKVENVSDTESFISKHNKYVSFYKDSFYIKEYAGKVYRRNKTFNAQEYSIDLDEVSKRIIGIKLYNDDNIYLISTYFDNIPGKSGYYDTYLNRKYYYHITRKEQSFDRSKLVSIDSDDDIVYGTDLDNRQEAIRLLRRV